MHTTISHTSYNWLTIPDAPSFIISAGQTIPHTPIPMPDTIGTGWFSSIQLPLNIVIRRGSHHFKPEAAGRLIPLANFKEEYSEPVLFVQTAKTGRITLYDYTLGEEYIFGSHSTLFRHIDKLDSQPKLDTSEDSELTVLIIGDSVLKSLLGDEQAHNLLESLRIAAMPSAVVTKVPHHISALLHASMPEHLTGNVRMLFAQAKVLEYICALSEHFVGDQRNKSKGDSREKQLLRLREELNQLEGKVPTLDELARQYGMSARLLNDEFKKLYGSTIYTYISELRLNEAHEALLKTTVPMKTLAINLGYSHVNHFISAFGKKFGYSPGSLRKKS